MAALLYNKLLQFHYRNKPTNLKEEKKQQNEEEQRNKRAKHCQQRCLFCNFHFP